MEMPVIAWNELWGHFHRQKRRDIPQGPRMWDKRAVEFTRAANKGDYIEQFIDILDPRPEWSLLDVGCAAGTLAVPLASRMRSITAVDPSTRMRELLGERCVAQGLTNVRILEGSWEADWDALGIGVHDVAVASRSLITEDLEAAVRKLSSRASKRVIMSALVDEGPHDRRIIEAAGRPFDGGADYIVVYNVLRQMGIHANVGFTHTREDRTFADVDEALKALGWMVPDMTGEEAARLRTHLQATLVPAETGGRLKLPYPRHTRWAVMWWDKDLEPALND